MASKAATAARARLAAQPVQLKPPYEAPASPALVYSAPIARGELAALNPASPLQATAERTLITSA